MNPESPSTAPRHFSLSVRVEANALRNLGRVAQELTFRQGESFLLTGDLKRSILFLKHGVLQRDSADFVLDQVEAGAIFGEARGSGVMRGKALETSCVWVIPRSEFDGFVRAHPELALKLRRTVSLLAPPEPAAGALRTFRAPEVLTAS